MPRALETRDIADVLRDVEQQVSDSVQLTLFPKRIEASTFIDGLDNEAWDLLLILPRPSGDSWDSRELFETRSHVRAAFDNLTLGTDLELPGLTQVSFTTDEATGDELAIEEGPLPDEDPSVPGDGG